MKNYLIEVAKDLMSLAAGWDLWSIAVTGPFSNDWSHCGAALQHVSKNLIAIIGHLAPSFEIPAEL